MDPARPTYVGILRCISDPPKGSVASGQSWTDTKDYYRSAFGTDLLFRISEGQLAVNRIRVAIVKAREDDFLPLTIADGLARAPEFEIVHNAYLQPSDDYSKLHEIAAKADVLIAIGDYRPDLLERIIQDDPTLVVSGILFGEDLVNLRLRSVGNQQLIETLGALARDRARLLYAESSGGTHQQLRYVERTPDEKLTALADAWLRCLLAEYWEAVQGDATDMLGNRRAGQVGEVLKPKGKAEHWERQLFGRSGAPVRTGSEPIGLFHQRLGLSEQEFKLLLIAFAPELAIEFQTAFGLMNDDLGRKYPTFGLACALLGRMVDVRADLEKSGRIVHWRLLESGEPLPRPDDIIQLAQPLPSWLLGGRDALVEDRLIRPFLRRSAYPGASILADAEGEAFTSDLIASLLGNMGLWTHLRSNHIDRWRARCEKAARQIALPLLRCVPSAILTLAPADQREAVLRLSRTAHLLGMTPVVDFGVEPADDARLGLLALFVEAFAKLPQTSILIAEDARFVAALPRNEAIAHRVDQSETPASAIYSAAAKAVELPLDDEVSERLGDEFPLPLEQIGEAADLAAQGAGSNNTYRLFANACRKVATPTLSRMAQVVTPSFTLGDVVLPDGLHEQLHEIVGQVSNASTVMSRWGFGDQLPYGRGCSVLLSGASGTGKSMAAQAIACELKTELFIVDLSRVVSKYIGESEKNLDAVFADAERAKAVLAIDEADAICGKRGETKDAHDRYANLEVAYLLQRMESFSGLAILTTNFKQNIDQAFLRRLRFVIDFPKPDASARLAIWRQCLPKAAPLARDVDFRLLAQEVELTGGHIRQITVRAAFAAAGEGGVIEMRHIFAATRAELTKLGQSTALRTVGELQAYHHRAMAA